jgi:YHS domain-containing protein
MGIFGNRKEGKESKGRSGAQHKDPVCGMLVVEAEAVGPDTYHGEVYWFCGEGCQGTFQEREGLRGQEQDPEVAR